MDIDRALARAMEADDPGPQFAARVVAAITAGDGAAAPPARQQARPRSLAWRAVLPLAATITMATAGAGWHARRAAEEARAREAQAQLVQALRLAGEQLNVVHRAIERSQE